MRSFTWGELKAKLNELSETQLAQPAAIFDSNYGEFFGIDGLGPVSDWAEGGYDPTQLCLSVSDDDPFAGTVNMVEDDDLEDHWETDE